MLKRFLFLVAIVWFHTVSNGEIRLRTKGFRCTSSNQTVSSDFQCFAKTYSRNYSTMNFWMKFKRVAVKTMVFRYASLVINWCDLKQHFQAEYDLQLRKTDEFRSVVNTKLKLCEFLEGAGNNIAIKWLFDLFKNSLPENTLHRCPYDVLSAYNVTVDTSLLISSNLRGVYRGTFRMFDDDDHNILTMIHDLEITFVNTPTRKFNA